MSAAVTTAKPNCSEEYQIFRSGVFHEAEAGHLIMQRQCISGAEAVHFFRRARWMYKMPSNGRDFPGKVCPTAFSKCRRPRKDSNIAPGGQVFCLPSAAVTYHRPRFILMAPSQGSWKCTVSGEFEMTLSGKYKCPASADKRMPPPPP